MLQIPQNYIELLIVVGLSLVIGLSQRKHQMNANEQDFSFGTDRTFTLIGLLSYILYIVDVSSKFFWAGGGIVITLLLMLNYYFKSLRLKRYGITTIITALITYCLPLLICTQPLPLVFIVLVLILFVTEMKETFISVATKMNHDEFITLAKFLIIAGIVLPILPNESLFDFIEITPQKIWLSTVIISGLSYLSYLLQKFIFPKSGLLLSALLGGMYSSTATTIVLARKSKNSPVQEKNRYSGAIILSSAMMYVRCCILLLIFNPQIFFAYWHYFLLPVFSTFIIAIFIYYQKQKNQTELTDGFPEKNPLEFKVAFIFALLFVVFTLATHFTILYFGNKGLNLLALFVGITDITPFLTGLYQNTYGISASPIVLSTFLATFSNQIMKWIYTSVLGNPAYRKTLFFAFAGTVLMNLIVVLLLLLLHD